MRAAALLLLLAGCGTTPVALSLTPRPNLAAEDYAEVLDRWTREDRIYDGLESKLFVFATFHSPELRRAFLLRHPDVYGRGSEVARRLALTDPEADEAIEFFFSAFTTDATWNDFDKPDSIWRVVLSGDDQPPVDGKVVRIKTTANLRVIYPFITDFARTYAVRFPRTDENGDPVISAKTRSFTLRFISAIGTAKLVWILAPAE